MAKKGLISNRVSRIAEALSLRPALKINNDKSGIGGIWMGSRRYAYRRYIKSAFPVDIIPDAETAFVTYVDVPEETLLWIKEEISRMAYFEHIVFQKASAAIATNCGPGTFGVLYFAKSNKKYNISSLLPQELPKENEETNTEEKTGIREKKKEEVKERKEPKWYENIEGIDGELAIKNSGSEEAFATVLKLFYEAIDEKINELNGFYDSEDWSNYTIKIHALKSSAKLVGAMSLSEEALLLEMAGKENNVAFIKGSHKAFLELSDYAIPEEEQEKYDKIHMMAQNYDYDGILEALGIKGEE